MPGFAKNLEAKTLTRKCHDWLRATLKALLISKELLSFCASALMVIYATEAAKAMRGMKVTVCTLMSNKCGCLSPESLAEAGPAEALAVLRAPWRRPGGGAAG